MPWETSIPCGYRERRGVYITFVRARYYFGFLHLLADCRKSSHAGLLSDSESCDRPRPRQGLPTTRVSQQGARIPIAAKQLGALIILLLAERKSMRRKSVFSRNRSRIVRSTPRDQQSMEKFATNRVKLNKYHQNSKESKTFVARWISARLY